MSEIIEYMSKQKVTIDGRQTLINNIINANSLPEHVVISAINCLYHVSQKGDEKYLFPLLNSDNKNIAGAALASLTANFHYATALKDQMLHFAASYPENEEGGYELQMYAIFGLANLATDDVTILDELLVLAETYTEMPNNFDAASMNSQMWVSLADILDIRITGDEQSELSWNPLSERSEKIRDRIRFSIKK